MENSGKLNNPHDKLFKAAFKVKETVIEYLQKFFPKELFALINLNDLVLDPTDYVSSDLNEYYSDVVYRTRLEGKEAALVLLFEHKTSITRALFLQLLEYMLAIWKKDYLEKRPFTIIIPIVVYRGKRGFKKKPFYQYFPNLPEQLRPFIPQFDFILNSVQKIGDEMIFDLNDNGLLKTLLLAFKHMGDTDFVVKNFNEFFKFYEENEHLKDFFLQFLLYLYHQSDLNRELIRDLVNQLPQPLNSTAMSTYAQIKEEGKIEGKIENEKLVIRHNWLKGHSAQTIADFTGYDINYIKSIIAQLEKEN